MSSNLGDFVCNKNVNPKFQLGKLILFIGPMFSKKTTKLINEICTCADVGLSVAYINHSIDERVTESSDSAVTTHSSQFRGLSSKIKSFKVPSLSNVDVSNFDVIGVDESGFFDDLFANVVNWVENLHKIVFVAGLDGDVFKNPIGDTLKLIPYADSIIKLTAHCKPCMISCDNNHRTLCLIDAPFTVRTTNDTKSILVGGSDLYMPVCRRCYQLHYSSNH